MVDPSRFKDRGPGASKRAEPLPELPPEYLPWEASALWADLRDKMWWLDVDDQVAFEGLCMLHAKIRSGNFETSTYNAWLRTVKDLGGVHSTRFRLMAERGIGQEDDKAEKEDDV